MCNLNTFYPTKVFDDYIIDPSIMINLIEESDKKRTAVIYDYIEFNHYHRFIRDVCSNFLELNGFFHNKEKWHMDVIRYKLKNVTKKRITL